MTEDAKGKKARSPDDESDLIDENIQLSFALTREDLLWYNLYFVRYLVYGFFVFLFLFAIGFIMALKTPRGDLQTALIWLEVFLGIGISICAGTMTAIVLQIYFLKNRTVDRAMTQKNYIINSAGVAVFDEKNKIVRTWNKVLKVIKTRQGFYIRTGDKLAIIIPRRAFKDADELKVFEKILIEYG
jgi:hypothetical protein